VDGPWGDHNLLVSDLETQKVVRTWLEEMKPDTVLTHWPIDTHENHAAVYELVWRCYKQRTGGWNPYLYEIETGAESLAFQPQRSSGKLRGSLGYCGDRPPRVGARRHLGH
jgi:LmbE family N-acetylglucosaminyl deacetylase